MGLVLGIDTATSACGAAVVRDRDCLSMRQERMARGQSEALMPMVEAVLAEAGVTAAALDAVAVTRGPGAFTGLRIGLAAARAFALTIGKPCLGIGTFQAVAAEVLETSEEAAAADALLIAIETKREDLYLQLIDPAGEPLCPGVAAPPDAAIELCSAYGSVAVAGDGAARAAVVLGARAVQLQGYDVASPISVARLAQNFLGDPAAAPATPLYLRPPDVTLPRKA